MNQYAKKISDYVDNHKEEMLALWEDLVNMESFYEEKSKVESITQRLKNEFEKAGFTCRIDEVHPDMAGTLVGILGEERGTQPIIFSGHIDTVHPTGSFGEKPFKIVGDKAFGPGVLDMKGGIVIALYVAKALSSIGYNEHPIKIMFAGEEESDHLDTLGGEVMRREAAGALCAFNMETGRFDHKLCVGRKTIYTCYMNVQGKGGHSGNEFTTSKNALEEAVYKIIEMRKLTKLEAGTAISCNIIHAGTHSAGIPGECNAVFDMRFTNADEVKRILDEVKEIMGKIFIEGTSTSYKITHGDLPAFETTDKIMNFYNFVNDTAIKNCFPDFGHITLGGASDAGNIALAGVPVLCSCGVTGEFNHSTNEYAYVNSLFARTKIFATIITHLNNWK